MGKKSGRKEEMGKKSGFPLFSVVLPLLMWTATWHWQSFKSLKCRPHQHDCQHGSGFGTFERSQCIWNLFKRSRCRVPDASKLHNCIPDEHYVQTLLAQHGLEDEITRRSLTHTAWDTPAYRGLERHGWHPVTYKLLDATSKLIKDIKKVDNINYETEYRKEWCTSKGKSSFCFLFARKFTRAAALRLLHTGVLAF